MTRRRHAARCHLGVAERQAEEHHRNHEPTAACNCRKTRGACSKRPRRAQLFAVLSQRALERHQNRQISQPRAMHHTFSSWSKLVFCRLWATASFAEWSSPGSNGCRPSLTHGNPACGSGEPSHAPKGQAPTRLAQETEDGDTGGLAVASTKHPFALGLLSIPLPFATGFPFVFPAAPPRRKLEVETGVSGGIRSES